MTCPLCGQRKARRECPALQQQICPVCCGTKRIVEIRCPSDCPYLSAAREHPPAVKVRQQEQDVAVMMRSLRDFSERQSQLFLMTGAAILGYEPPELQALRDEDVAAAGEALAATFQTAASGVIYEHPAATVPAERLARELRAAFKDWKAQQGSAFDRDAAVVLARIADTVREMRAKDAGNPKALLELLARTLHPARTSGPDASNVSGGDSVRRPAPGLIVP